MKTITLCGSLKFQKEMMIVAEKMALKGNCILTPVYPVSKNIERTKEQLIKLKEAHFKRIELSDTILVVNVNNYIGVSKTTVFLDNDQRIKLKEILTEICLNYQIEIIEQTKKQEMQKNNTDILNKFISSKEIEGCSTRTLNYYRENINKMLDAVNLSINENCNIIDKMV